MIPPPTTTPHTILFDKARSALFDLFKDASVPPAELRAKFELLAELIRLQINALDATIDQNTTL